jgi:hypothetical protein
MLQNEWKDIVSEMAMVLLMFLNLIVLQVATVENKQFYWAFLISLPLLILVFWYRFKKFRK